MLNELIYEYVNSKYYVHKAFVFQTGNYYNFFRLAIIDHISSPSALVFPVQNIISELHKLGVLVLIDGAHAPGIIKKIKSWMDEKTKIQIYLIVLLIFRIDLIWTFFLIRYILGGIES